MPAPRPLREAGIDALRALGALGVIQIHFGPFRGAEWDGTPEGALSVAASFAARSAVPFFFVTSGYLLARPGRRGTLQSNALAQGRRILSLFVTWSFLALVVRGALRAGNRLNPAEFLEPFARFADQVRARPLDALLGGTEEHLWFLPALVTGMWMYAAMESKAWSRRLVPAAAVAVALVGLGINSYAVFALPLDLNPRSGPFLAFPMVTLGAWLAQRPLPSLRTAILVLVAGIGLMIAECARFLNLTGASVVSHDALVSFYVTGPALLAIARHLSGRITDALAAFGRLTLGVYSCHTLAAAIVFDLLRRFGGALPAHVREIGAFLLVTGVATGVTLVLAHFPRTRRLVQ